MVDHNNKFDMTPREQDVMEILWASDKPVTIAEISEKGITKSTVLGITKKLLEKDLIKVADYIYSGTVICRCFVPALSRAEFEEQNLFHTFDHVKMPTSHFIASLLNRKEDREQVLAEINDLEEMLKAEKEKLLKQEDSGEQQEK